MAAILLASGCGDSSSTDARPQALLGADDMALPWPSDALRADGHLRVEGLALGGSDRVIRDLEAALDDLDGAPVSGSIFFPVSGGSLADGPLTGAVAHVVDLDATSPEAPYDLPITYRDLTHELAAFGEGGHVRREGHVYAAWIDAAFVRPSTELGDALAGRGARAPLYAPLVQKLGSDVARVGAATVFTVGHPAARLLGLRDRMPAASPSVVVDRVITGAGLDDFFGAPSTSRAGLGDPKGIVHDAIGSVVLGRIEGVPYFLSGGPDHLGRIALDASGAPVQQGTTSLPFLLSVPRDRPAGPVPLLVYQHGLNAGRWQVAAVANDYARAGYAAFGIDALWHGSRRPGSVDEKHNFSGQPGPDGLADDDPLGASILFFDFNGDSAAGVHGLDGRVLRDNFHEAALEVLTSLRAIRAGALDAVAPADPSLSGVSFDGANVVYTSESFGSVLGAIVAGIDPDLRAAVLSVGGAGIFLPIFADSPYFSKLVGLILKSSIDPDLDVSDPSRLPAEAQRSLSMLEAAIEPADPIAFAPLVAASPEPGHAPRSLLLLEAFSDELIPNQGGELLALRAGATAVRVDGHTHALRFQTLPEASAPFSANFPGATVALLDVDPATHVMYTAFTATRGYEVGFPPARPLATPETIDNPIEWLHGVATRFADGARAGATPVVSAP